jgi:hypothetical protein
MFVRDLQQGKREIAMSSFGGRAPDVVEHEQWAAIILDGMYQFVALLNLKGDILEEPCAAYFTGQSEARNKNLYSHGPPSAALKREP